MTAIPINNFPSFIKSLDRAIDKRLSVHQRLRDYTLGDLMLMVKKSVGPDRIEMWYDNKKAAQGLRDSGFFSTDAPTVEGPANKLTAQFHMLETQQEMYDYRAMVMNKSQEQIYSLAEQIRARATQAICESIEDLVYNPLKSDGTGIAGIREHLRFNLQSGGTTVSAQATPAQNGVYTLSSNAATARSTWQGQDRAVAEDIRSNYTATFANGTAFGRQEAQLLKRLARRAKFTPSKLMDKDGTPVSRDGMNISSLKLVMSPDDADSYIEAVNAREADRDARDLLPEDVTRVGGMGIVVSDRLQRDALLPVFGLDLNKWEWKYAGDEFWLKRSDPIPHPSNPKLVFYRRYDMIGQLIVRDALTAGFTACRTGTMSIAPTA
jgi:hypothetical protein